MRLKFYENKRKGISFFKGNLIEMLITVKKAREEIIMKLDNINHVKPGTFIQPIEKLIKKDEDDDFEKAEKSKVLRSANDEVMKFLEMQSATNKEQMNFFMRAHERRDVNLKKNMELVLTSLKKREQLDFEYF